jgi:hypothetical protein
MAHDAQEVAHACEPFLKLDVLRAPALAPCGRLRRKLRSGAQVPVHFCFVIGFGVRLNLLFNLLSY